MTSTTADVVAERFRHGLRFRDGDDWLQDVAQADYGATTTHHWDRTRLEFPDGSAIVICGDAWDLGYPARQGPRFEWHGR